MIAVAAMAVPVSASSYFVSSCTITRQAVCSVSSSSCCSSSGAIYWPKTSALYISSSPFASWSGLKGLSMSRSVKSAQTGRKRRRRGMVVYASLFGVGAPEALVIGVVALLVFGPKGLAEVARNLGKTLRAFQPTIRELQDVSKEFKSTLEREIGLDELSAQNTYNVNRSNPTSSPSTITREQAPEPVVDPNGATSSPQAYSSEEYLRVTEEQLKAVASQQSEQPQQATSSGETSAERPETQSKPQVDETPSTTPPSVKSESGT